MSETMRLSGRARRGSKTPFDSLMDDVVDYPEKYMFKCGLCHTRVFARLKRDVVAKRAEHERDTGHNISFLRWPIRGGIGKP